MIGPKASKFHKVDPPAGVNDLFSLIAFLQDPKAVKDQLKKIQEYTDKANDSVERLYKTEEIDRLLLDAETKHNEAVEKSIAAKNEAASIIEDAKNKAVSIEETTRASIGYMQREAEKLKQDADSLLFEARKEAETATQALREAHTLKQSLATLRNDLETRETEIRRKEALLSQL